MKDTGQVENRDREKVTTKGIGTVKLKEGGGRKEAEKLKTKIG
jgi:hypothetical protein